MYAFHWSLTRTCSNDPAKSRNVFRPRFGATLNTAIDGVASVHSHTRFARSVTAGGPFFFPGRWSNLSILPRLLPANLRPAGAK